jgi:large subunit ribosomal protein L35
MTRKDKKMPKLKTKSGCKKRFKFTATGKVVAPQAGKRHGMSKRTNRFIRNARGTTIMDDADQHRIVQYMPYGSR